VSERSLAFKLLFILLFHTIIKETSLKTNVFWLKSAIAVQKEQKVKMSLCYGDSVVFSFFVLQVHFCSSGFDAPEIKRARSSFCHLQLEIPHATRKMALVEGYRLGTVLPLYPEQRRTPLL